MYTKIYSEQNYAVLQLLVENLYNWFVTHKKKPILNNWEQKTFELISSYIVVMISTLWFFLISCVLMAHFGAGKILRHYDTPEEWQDAT
ncbi:hypothetical protein QE439_004199 [Pedobacter agri]|nr:hypothetical protein [Pedobacter agri]